MTALITKLNNLNIRVSKLSKLTDNNRLIEQQRKNISIIDSSIARMYNLNKVLVYLRDEFNFELSNASQSNYSKALETAKRIYMTSTFDDVEVNGVNEKYKALEKTVGNEWKQFYKELTNNTLSILNIIKGVNTDKISNYIDKIKAVEIFTFDLEKYKRLKRALDDSSELIDNAELDDDIKQFLIKMNKGKATINDLNEKNLTWIRNMHIGSNIKLLFNKK